MQRRAIANKRTGASTGFVMLAKKAFFKFIVGLKTQKEWAC